MPSCLWASLFSLNSQKRTFPEKQVFLLRIVKVNEKNLCACVYLCVHVCTSVPSIIEQEVTALSYGQEPGKVV